MRQMILFTRTSPSLQRIHAPCSIHCGSCLSFSLSFVRLIIESFKALEAISGWIGYGRYVHEPVFAYVGLGVGGKQWERRVCKSLYAVYSYLFQCVIHGLIGEEKFMVSSFSFVAMPFCHLEIVILFHSEILVAVSTLSFNAQCSANLGFL